MRHNRLQYAFLRTFRKDQRRQRTSSCREGSFFSFCCRPFFKMYMNSTPKPGDCQQQFWHGVLGYPYTLLQHFFKKTVQIGRYALCGVDCCHHKFVRVTFGKADAVTKTAQEQSEEQPLSSAVAFTERVKHIQLMIKAGDLVDKL